MVMGFPSNLSPTRTPKKPWGLQWRSSVWFITTVVGFGITTDLLVYSIIIPVIPFQLENLGFHGVSALTGWLLCAYSAGLVISTIPIAMYSERSTSRRTPLVIGLIALLSAQVLLMEAPNYALMAVARALQGISSSMVWIVGLALLCDTTPEKSVGRQLGIAMAGLSVGLLVGTPAGGALYTRFGFRAPFIFGEICTAVDLILRFLIIERDEAMKWGHDPSIGSQPDPMVDLEALSLPQQASGAIVASGSNLPQSKTTPEETSILTEPKPVITGDLRPSTGHSSSTSDIPPLRKPLPLLSVISRLGQSPRAVVALIMALIYGTVNSMLEPSLPLRLQAVWGYNSDQVGLVYMAALGPALISSPLAGILADREGSDYLACTCLLLALPWWVVLTFKRSISLFVSSLALQCFFVSGVVSPVTAELAAVSRDIQGIGYGHVYGAFNLAFGIGTAVGPVLGGQAHLRSCETRMDGTLLHYRSVHLLCIVLAFCHTGADPLLSKVLRQYNLSQVPLEMKPSKHSAKEQAVSTENPPGHLV
ncbi:MFS general substrate transporter [Melanogaster broomeanus]|nr:MFS general substrate transporter [Melanogaster broomeanus]